jgi:hypothetical protein
MVILGANVPRNNPKATTTVSWGPTSDPRAIGVKVKAKY